jgi:lipid-binding SYLF domain-containing protein
MKAPFIPTNLSAAIVTLSLMSAPLYTAAQATDDETVEGKERVERAAENRPAIEERSYDTQQAAEELTDETEEAAAETQQETEQAAAEAEQETEQAAAEMEEETAEAAAGTEQETEQAAAELEQETEQAAAETEQETEQAAAELEQETEQAAAETEQETEQAAAELDQETDQAAAELDSEEEGVVEGETLVDDEEAEVAAAGETDAQDEELSGPMEDVQESAEVVQNMQQEADMQQLLDRAKGVFIIPDYATAALIVGGEGGKGVLLKKQEDDSWSNPVFYNVGGLSVGLQAGAAAGSIAMVLLSENAIETFGSETNFGFTADAGFSIINWSERARAEIGMGTDAVVWTDTEGLFGELAVGVTGVTPDEEDIAEYYEQEAEPSQILAGDVENPHDEMLQQALREQ